MAGAVDKRVIGIPRPLSLILAAAVLAVAAWAVFGRSSVDERYVEQVTRLCHGTEEALKGTSGTYFESVVFISHRKVAGLEKIAPPPDREALHRTLLESERRLAGEAAAVPPLSHPVTADALTAFSSLRAKQAELDASYRSLGIKSCSD